MEVTAYRVSWNGQTQEVSTNYITIDSLSAGKTYTVRVEAKNSVGYSQPESISVTTKEAPPAPIEPEQSQTAAIIIIVVIVVLVIAIGITITLIVLRKKKDKKKAAEKKKKAAARKNSYQAAANTESARTQADAPQPTTGRQ